jgi:hypothetical protein
MSLIQDMPFPPRPPEGVTNGWMLQSLKTLRKDVLLDAERNAALREQVAACGG